MARRTIVCEDCGVLVKRNMRGGRAHVCVTCGLARAERAALQMAAKSGPAWEAFQASRGAQGRVNAPRDDQGRFATGQEA